MRGEMVLGVIAGIFGIIASVILLGIGGLGSAFGMQGAEMVVGASIAALILSIMGIIGGALIDKNKRLSGVLMLIAGIGGFIAISAYWLISGPLFIVGGIMALKRK